MLRKAGQFCPHSYGQRLSRTFTRHCCSPIGVWDSWCVKRGEALTIPGKFSTLQGVDGIEMRCTWVTETACFCVDR